MEYIEKKLYSLNSPELRLIIKEYRKQTGTKVPPISRAKKIVLIDIIKDFEIIKTLKDLKNPNLLIEQIEKEGEKKETVIETGKKEQVREKLEKIELKDDMSIEEEPEPVKKEEDNVEKGLTKEDISNSIEDLQYDIDYLQNYSPQSDELKELQKQLFLYNTYYKQNY